MYEQPVFVLAFQQSEDDRLQSELLFGNCEESQTNRLLTVRLVKSILQMIWSSIILNFEIMNKGFNKPQMKWKKVMDHCLKILLAVQDENP